MRYVACLVLWLSSLPARGSTIEECIANCAVWIWGPSQTTLETIVRAPPFGGYFNGHYGTFIYEDYKLTLAPYLWYSLTDFVPSDPGPAVYTGWEVYTNYRLSSGGVRFEWYDPGFIPDPEHLHYELVTPATVTSDTFEHAKYLWQCNQGITPPDNVEFPPEPATLFLTGSALIAIGLMMRRRMR